MQGSSLRLGRWFGIDIRADASWLVIAFLVGWSFFAQYTIGYPDLATTVRITLAATSAVIFFGSVLLHELSHSLMARRLGIPVEDITLFIFGGVTKTKQESRRPRDEFLIAVVGPLTSFLIAAVLWAVSRLGAALLPEPVSYGLGYLAWINLALGIFNLLPGYPLDGGRVLRSVLWGASGNQARATRGAAVGGKLIGGLLAAFGVFRIFAGDLTGLWLAAIGWFLFQAAATAEREVVMRRLLTDVIAGDLMTPDPVTISADMTLAQAVDDYFLRYDHSAFPVAGDSRDGLITLRAVRQIPRDQWEVRQVWSVMTPLADACTVPMDAPMDSVLEELRQHDDDRVLVVAEGRIRGIITSRDIARWIRRSQELGLAHT
jgi:Zn-dependent protease/CBS domain-containing protein